MVRLRQVIVWDWHSFHQQDYQESCRQIFTKFWEGVCLSNTRNLLNFVTDLVRAQYENCLQHVRAIYCTSVLHTHTHTRTHAHTHTRLTALFPGIPRWAGTRKAKPIWILLEQETVSGSGISWAIRKSAPRSRQITMPAPHFSVFYRPDALPAAQPTVSKHWRQYFCINAVN